MAAITIARQFGAGGRTLGNLLAEDLGYTLVDEEIVEMVAIEANVSPDWVDSVEKDTGSAGFMARLLTRLGPFRKGYVEVSMEKRPGYIDGDLYISLLHKVIPELAAKDNVVIIGRGAQYILANRPDTYHFLLIADLDYRIRFMMEHYDLDRKQAQIVVEKQTKRRFNLYRYFGRTDYDDPALYDMAFNMKRVKMMTAAETIRRFVTDRPAS